MKGIIAGRVVLLLIAIFITTPCQGQVHASGNSHLQQGDAAYAQFDNRSALQAYEKAHAQAPHDTEILIRLTRIHYDMGLDFLAEGNPKKAESFFQEAVAIARQLVDHSPLDARSHLLVAVTLGNLAMFKGGGEKVQIGREVEKFSTQAIALDSSFALPYMTLGIYHRELASLNWIERSAARIIYGHLPKTNLDTALKYLRKAETLAPDHPFLHFELAHTLAKKKDYQAAIYHMQRFEDLPPQTTQDVRNRKLATEAIASWQSLRTATP